MSVAMFELKRIVLWLFVLLAPGGLFLLPLLILDAGKSAFWKARTRRA
jgi:hypothetical protein